MSVKKLKIPGPIMLVAAMLGLMWVAAAVIGNGLAFGATIGGGVVILHYDGDRADD